MHRAGGEIAMFNFEIIKDNILTLQDKYDNAVAVMGGAYWAAQEVHSASS